MSVERVDLSGFQGLKEEILVDTQDLGRRYLIITPGGHHIKLAPGAYYLLKGAFAGQSFAALANDFSSKSGRRVSTAAVREAYAKVANNLAEIANQGDRRITLPTGFWLKIKIVPVHVVERVASALSVAYQPLAATSLLAFIACTAVWMWSHAPETLPEGADAWAGYLLFILSLVTHELGHASASARYGARPCDIGFAFYIIYPAFYSDVTSAWQLSRRQRVIVDLGGFYFQFIAAGVFVVAYAIWQWPALWVAVLLITYSAVFSLNPIFRFDGYWVLVDALGVTNLAKQPAIFFRYLMAIVRGNEPEPLPWPRWLAVVLCVYSALAIVVWCYFLWMILPFFSDQLTHYPALVEMTWQTYLDLGWGPEVRQKIARLLASSLIIFVIGFALWRLASRPAGRLRGYLLIQRARREAKEAL